MLSRDTEMFDQAAKNGWMRRLAALSLACALCITLAAPAAEAGTLRMTTTRPYISGYRVEDGFLIPEISRFTDGVVLSVPSTIISRDGRYVTVRIGVNISSSTIVSRPTVIPIRARMFRRTTRRSQEIYLNTQQVPLQEPEPVRPQMTPEAITVLQSRPRTTTTFGAVRTADGGPLTAEARLILVVDPDGKKIVYNLADDAPIRELLEASGEAMVSAIVIGKVVDTDPSQTLYVRSAHAVDLPTAQTVPDTPEADPADSDPAQPTAEEEPAEETT